MTGVTVPRLRECLPDIYAAILPPFFDLEVPAEGRADCSRCSMVAPPGADGGGLVYFDPGIRCCSYRPVLPAYQVGQVLSGEGDGMDRGREILRGIIARGDDVTPAGVLPGNDYVERFVRLSPGSFGRDPGLLCPFLDAAGGRCAIWPCRDATCSTWFCRPVGREDGRRFWKAVGRYLDAIQAPLVAHALRRLGWREETIPEMTAGLARYEAVMNPGEGEGIRRDGSAGDPWKGWRHGKEEYYRRAFGIIAGLGRAEFDLLAGPAAAAGIEAIRREAEARHRPVLPDRSRCNTAMEVRPEPAGGVLLLAGFEPCRVSAVAWGAISLFDGLRTNAEVREECRRRGVGMTDGFLISLHQARILVGAEDPVAGDDPIPR